MGVVIYADSFIISYTLLLMVDLLIYSISLEVKIKILRLVISSLAGAGVTLIATALSIASADSIMAVASFVLCVMLVYVLAFGVEGHMPFAGIIRGSMFLIFISMVQVGLFITTIGLLKGAFNSKWGITIISAIVQVLGIIVLCLFIRQLNERSLKVRIILVPEGINLYVNGLIDSGNLLRTPDDASSVMIIAKKYQLLLDGYLEERFTLEAYTVSGSSVLDGGYLSGIKILPTSRIKGGYYKKVAVVFGNTSGDIGAIIPKSYEKGGGRYD